MTKRKLEQGESSHQPGGSSDSNKLPTLAPSEDKAQPTPEVEVEVPAEDDEPDWFVLASLAGLDESVHSISPHSSSSSERKESVTEQKTTTPAPKPTSPPSPLLAASFLSSNKTPTVVSPVCEDNICKFS